MHRLGAGIRLYRLVDQPLLKQKYSVIKDPAFHRTTMIIGRRDVVSAYSV
jgi:hypothetical protein